MGTCVTNRCNAGCERVARLLFQRSETRLGIVCRFCYKDGPVARHFTVRIGLEQVSLPVGPLGGGGGWRGECGVRAGAVLLGGECGERAWAVLLAASVGRALSPPAYVVVLLMSDFLAYFC
jgi:hypothetical protein